jgi:hypothetical protein
MFLIILISKSFEISYQNVHFKLKQTSFILLNFIREYNRKSEL